MGRQFDTFPKMATPLDGLIVAELGGRESVAVCGMLLAQLGAKVFSIETPATARPKDALRTALAGGKSSLSLAKGSTEDKLLLRRLLAGSDIVLKSSDLDPPWLDGDRYDPGQIICDIQAFGSSQGLGSGVAGEWEIQALTGLIDTTGWPDAPPIPIAIPVVGYLAGINAATGILAALRLRQRDGIGKDVEVSMYDSAFVAMNAYLAGILTGAVDNRGRVGNRHTTVSPWNSYATRDGSIQICAGNQIQWKALCDVMARPDLLTRYPTQGSRLDCVQELDAEIETWTSRRTTAECEGSLRTAGIAAAAVISIGSYPEDPNLIHRNMVADVETPDGTTKVAGTPFPLCGSPAVTPTSVPAVGAGRKEALELPARQVMSTPKTSPTAGQPLEGLRVIELGQYTTAPMCGRLMAHLGADVIKVEKPGGDEQRGWVPMHHGISETFWLNNIDKRGLSLDLHTSSDRDIFARLLNSADVLVENNKPGTLAKFGFSADNILNLKPDLIYCAISGFGADTLYPRRPGFDTVIQAASGFMAAVNPWGEPVKSGFSAADVVGAQFSLLSILAALQSRERTGRGQFIDMSMQDVTAWLTSSVWGGRGHLFSVPAVVEASDGCVIVSPEHAIGDDTMSREELVRRLSSAGARAASVRTIREAAFSEETLARGAWFSIPYQGSSWPVLGMPFKLGLAPWPEPRPAPEIDQDRAAILAELDNYSMARKSGWVFGKYGA